MTGMSETERKVSGGSIILDLTTAIMHHYGYTDADLEEADLIHPGRICREDECYDENGMSVHPSVYDEVRVTANLMAEVVEPWVTALLASRDARLAAVEALADDFAASKERAARWAAETHTAFREAMSRKVAWEEAERSLRAALRSDPDEASTDA